MPTIPPDASGFTLKFGFEELVTLVQSLGGETLRGLGDAPFAPLSKKEKELVIQSATHSLLARGYLMPIEGSEQLGIDETVRKIILLALHPLHIITMIRKTLNARSESYDYLAPEQLAIHHHASLGVHALDVTFSWPKFTENLTAALQPFLPKNTTGHAFLLPIATLKEAKQFAQKKQTQKALTILIQNDTPRDYALSLLNALAAPELEWFIHVQSLQSGLKSYEKALTILCKSQTCWSIQGENTGDNSGTAIISPLCQSNLREQMETLFLLI